MEAETILLLLAGQSVQEGAAQQGWRAETVRIRRRDWLKRGWASLSDQPRCDAPSKLADERRRDLSEWVEAEPWSARELITRVERGFAATVGPTTLRRELARLGYVRTLMRYM